MTSFAPLLQADQEQPATLLHVVDKAGLGAWMDTQAEATRRIVAAQGFKAEPHQVAVLPGSGAAWFAVAGVTDADKLGPWDLARAAELLPEGSYRLTERSPGDAALGWLLAHYKFDRYKQEPSPKGARVLLTDQPARIDELVAVAEATALVRDLVNLPAADLGPAELQAAAEAVAKECGGAIAVTHGKELATGYPMIAAVGAAASPERAPRLVELTWGDAKAPRVAIVGKGVIFDTGGLDIKNAAGMRLMKKDMGGAAHALALARLVMARRLPVRLQVLLPIAENAIASAALRPGDVLKSRNGLTVEIGNTDAEGRLILADALTRAVEEKPDLILDFATLTGAARIALGPDLPALFANDDTLAHELVASGTSVDDPVWRLPLWKPYGEMFASDVADLNNASEGAFAGAVVAALFLQRFVPDAIPWAHLDTFAWRPTAKPGRAKGGDALGLRAAWNFLKTRYDANTQAG